MVIGHTLKMNQDWENDFHLLKEWLEPNCPCYIVYRLQEGWLFIHYTPDTSKVNNE